MSDLPLYKLEDLDEEGWLEVNRLLLEHSWARIASMISEELQNLITERYVEVVKKVATKKKKRSGKKKSPLPLRKFIWMKRKVGRELRKSKNSTVEKIRELTTKIQRADLGIQNAARLKKEEERRAFVKIR